MNAGRGRAVLGGLGARRLVRHASSSAMPSRVKIYEVGARDGLQNEPVRLTPSERIDFCHKLARTGVWAVEAAAFVNPKLVPQMDRASDVLSGLNRLPNVAYPALTPNLKGFEDACHAGATTVAVMTAASETFSRNNTNSTIAQSMERAVAIAAEANARGVAVRGYMSTCLGCPFEGEVPPGLVGEMARELYAAGCYEVVVSDTIGVGTPGGISRVLAQVMKHVPASHIALHCERREETREAQP